MMMQDEVANRLRPVFEQMVVIMSSPTITVLSTGRNLWPQSVTYSRGSPENAKRFPQRIKKIKLDSKENDDRTNVT